MKIIHLIPKIGSSGGAERLVVQLSNEMALHNEVSIVTFRDTPHSSSYVKELSSNINLISLGKKQGFSFWLMFRLYRTIKKIKPDVLNAHLPATFLYLVFSILMLPRVNFVFTIHSLPTHEENRKWVVGLRKVLQKWNKLKIVTLSKISDDEMKAYYGVRGNAVIPNGITPPERTNLFKNTTNEIEKLKHSRSTRVFLNIGRIDSIKNQTMLCEVFHRLDEMGYDLTLIILGSPVDNIYSKEEYKHIQAYKNIHLLGLKNNIGDYLSNTDAFCLSSYKEGLPLVILEAMSYGLPVLSTPVGGVPDVIEDGTNGFISTDITFESYLEMMIKYLDLNKHGILRIKESNIDKFNKEYTIQKTCEKYLNFYNKLINE